MSTNQYIYPSMALDAAARSIEDEITAAIQSHATQDYYQGLMTALEIVRGHRRAADEIEIAEMTAALTAVRRDMGKLLRV